MFVLTYYTILSNKFQYYLENNITNWKLISDDITLLHGTVNTKSYFTKDELF